MHFVELNLNSFGKFKNRSIQLDPGLNVIYGENESGKTTVNDFITGMVFGFIKDSKKRTLYRDEHSRYTPWIGDAYSGSMTVVLGGHEYRIERNFSKGREDTVVLDGSTGLDISDDFVDDVGKRVSQLGQSLFGMTESMYLNTISISSMGAYDSSVAMELNDKLKNQSETSLEELSLASTLNYLNEKSLRLTKMTRPRELEKEIRELGIEEKLYSNRRSEYFELVDSLSDKSERLEELVVKIDRIKSAKAELKKIDLQSKSKEVIRAQTQIEEILKQIAELPEYTYTDERVQVELLNLLETISNIERDIETGLLRLKEYDRFELETEVYDESKFISLEEDYMALKSERSRSSNTEVNWIVPLVIAVVGVIAGAVVNKYFYISLLIPLLILGYNFTKRTKDESGILKSYGLSTFSDFENMYLEENAKYRNRMDKAILKERAEQGKAGIQSELDQLDRRHEECSKRLENIMKSENLHSVDEIYNIAEYKNKYGIYELKLNELENNIRLLSADVDTTILDEYTHADEERRAEYMIEIESEEEIVGIYNNLKDEVQRLTGEVLSREADIDKLGELRQKSTTLEKSMSDYTRQKEIIEETAEILNQLSTEGSRTLLPNIKASMGEHLREITGGKYSDVLIDSEYNIKVYDAETDSYNESSALSAGTVDQIYLAHKLAVLDSFSEELPIVFDDSFVNYDDRRLENTLRSLERVSKAHQIIIFTCQKRELEVLDELNIDYNRILL